MVLDGTAAATAKEAGVGTGGLATEQAYLCAMLPSIELPSRTLSLRTELNLMVVRWHPVVDTVAVQADYAQMLAAAKAHGMSA